VIADLVHLITEVWMPSTVLAAAGTGFAIGVLVLGYLGSVPTYAADGTPGQVGRVVAFGGALAGLVFYVGQAAATYADDDPNVSRIVSRFGLWVLYSLGMGLGTYVRLAHIARKRRKQVHQLALEELAPMEVQNHGHHSG
jgi:hypothetical protein